MSKESLLKEVHAYKALALQIERLEAQKAEIKAVLELEAIKNGGEVIVDVFKIKLITAERENFSLKKAREVLGDSLNPFITVSSYTQLRIG